jgi:hypothetical protein
MPMPQKYSLKRSALMRKEAEIKSFTLGSSLWIAVSRLLYLRAATIEKLTAPHP